MITYLHFTCEAAELNDMLNKYGSNGWRLHTCEPVPTLGSHGSGTLYAFVVMDKLVVATEEEPAVEPDVEGIPMKG